MIINTNMAALNTYRQLSLNEKATQSSLAKLSSGLRINSAADDAAGLSISEKMRGQISGLNQASSNAQNGISMVSTAEGALNETTSILQRMRELAVQAGNDTNTTDDRTAMQTEMNQLTSEINRIGNTTEFNTQKLLNGGRQINSNVSLSAATLLNGSANATVNVTAAAGTTGVDAVAAAWTSGAITKIGDDETGATVTFNGVTVTLNSAVGAVDANATNATTASVTVANGGTAEDTANALKAAFDATKAQSGSTLTNITFSVVGTGNAAQLVATDTKADGATNNAWKFDVVAGTTSLAMANDGLAATAGAGDTAGVTGVAQTATFAFAAAKPQEGSYITMADKKIAFWDSTGTNFSSAAEAKSVLNADFVVDIAGMTGTAINNATTTFNAIGAAGIAGYTLSDDGAGTLTLTANATGVDHSSTLESATSIATGDVNAAGNITFDAAPTEGSYISIGGKKISFFDSSLGNYSSATAAKAAFGSDFAVDVKGLNTDEVVNQVIALQTQLNGALPTGSKVNLGKNLNADGTINLTVTAQTAGFGGNKIALANSTDATAGFQATFQIGANTGQTMVIAIDDMRSQALGISSQASGSNAVAKNGATASFTTVKSASNGSDNNNIEYTLDISTTDKASAAVSVIDDAINKVSAERSNLGAYQNRLDHTINNLGTASQNITSAEANIRDVDMAQEMTNFQKNNILQQAAQAMLAQANQQPQGVLQLLR